MKRTPFKRKPLAEQKPMRKTRLNKKGKKRGSKQIMHDKAWAVFSKWIRNRDKRCVTCGSTSTPQAGHRWHGKLDFDEININQQCSACNKWRQGNLSKYDDYLISKYGMEGWTELYNRKNLATAGEYRTEQDYQEIINKYQIYE